MNDDILYVFLDESGDLGFSPKGSRFFSFCGVAMLRPFALYEQLDSYKHDLIESGNDIESFHYAHDKRSIRKGVLDVLNRNLSQLGIYSLIVEKRKTGPALQKQDAFYPRMLGYLLQYISRGYQFSKFKEIVVITDTIPVKRRGAVTKLKKVVLPGVLPAKLSYRILSHTSKAHYGIQIADYCSGAIFRKWERGDDRHYRNIKPALRSEYDIFQTGTRYYY